MKEFILTAHNFLAVIEARERQAERFTVVHKNSEGQTPDLFSAAAPKGSENRLTTSDQLDSYESHSPE